MYRVYVDGIAFGNVEILRKHIENTGKNEVVISYKFGSYYDKDENFEHGGMDFIPIKKNFFSKKYSYYSYLNIRSWSIERLIRRGAYISNASEVSVVVADNMFKNPFEEFCRNK